MKKPELERLEELSNVSYWSMNVYGERWTSINVRQLRLSGNLVSCELAHIDDLFN